MPDGLRIGGLFEGYGGLTAGVQAVLGGDLAWYSDCCKFDKKGNAGHYEPHRAPCSILAHHNPGVPNIGDVTKVDWSQVEPVDILTGGSPCQDLSHAGKRAGMTDGTRSNLWVAMREAIAQLRPGLVVWENVRGAYSACADSDLGRCPRCVDSSHPGGHAPLLRALGRVLGDLADLGYDAGWHGLRAADVGAPHGRMRVFVVAYPNSEGRGRVGWEHAERRDADGCGRADGSGAATESAPRLLKTPTSQLAIDGGSQHPDKRKAGGHGPTLADEVEHLLPTPAVNDMGAAYTPDEWDAWTDRMKAEHGNGNGHGKSLSVEAARLLPSPKASNFDGSTSDGFTPNLRERILETDRWGDYADAITRWEAVLGRTAPPPTMTSSKGNPQLAPAFVEWMMGLPAGWVTDVPGITRNEALKALGNGVVPQQAEAALRVLLPAISQAVA